ncbi:MAG: membrane integrity-associated transporter subunit PqiC [Methylobacterium sp.]|nr:membrane integrity-associated transporter subunit PqiC [Methylobacterium sp.]
MGDSTGLKATVKRQARACKAAVSSRLMAMALAGFLAGCAGSAPPPTFDLAAPRDNLDARPGRGLVVVAEPSALAAIDTNRITVMTRGGGLAYLGDAQWSDRLPRLVQVRLIQTFENANRLTTIGRPGDRLLPVAQLNSEIRRFGIDEATGEAVIEMSVRIVQDSTGRILAGKIFTRSVPADGASGPVAAAALDLAMQELLRDIVGWTSARI